MAELLSLLGAPEIEFVEFAKDDSTLFFRLGSPSAHLAPAHRPVPQLRGGAAQGAQQERHGAAPATCTRPSSAWRSLPTSARAPSRCALRKTSCASPPPPPKPASRRTRSRPPTTAEALSIGFNSQYLLDFLKATDSDNVHIEFKDSQSAGQLRPEGVDGLQVPLRRHADADLTGRRTRLERRTARCVPPFLCQGKHGWCPAQCSFHCAGQLLLGSLASRQGPLAQWPQPRLLQLIAIEHVVGVERDQRRPSGCAMWMQVFSIERTSKLCASMNCTMRMRKRFS